MRLPTNPSRINSIRAAAVAANDNKKVLIGVDDQDAPVYVARQTVAGKVELVSAKGGAR